MQGPGLELVSSEGKKSTKPLRHQLVWYKLITYAIHIQMLTNRPIYVTNCYLLADRIQKKKKKVSVMEPFFTILLYLLSCLSSTGKLQCFLNMFWAIFPLIHHFYNVAHSNVLVFSIFYQKRSTHLILVETSGSSGMFCSGEMMGT